MAAVLGDLWEEGQRDLQMCQISNLNCWMKVRHKGSEEAVWEARAVKCRLEDLQPTKKHFHALTSGAGFPVSMTRISALHEPAARVAPVTLV